MTPILLAAVVLGLVPASLRWLRVAQREHYLAPSVSRFAVRWWSHGLPNIALALLGLAGLVGSFFNPWLVLAAALGQVGPIGLGVRGSTSKLDWTGRLRRVASLTAALVLILAAVGWLLASPPVFAFTLVGLPGIIDVALVILAPIEKEIGSAWVDRAAARLATSSAEVVAITGSYGKTSTKGYVAHLLAGLRRVVASPASFNNRMGLARAVNEQLVPGTEVFIAEMGTYRKGEIAELCRWIAPDVAALVSVGPVHLERFRTLQRIVEAKAEIFDTARIGVISIDHPLLAELARHLPADMEVVTVSAAGAHADVWVDGRWIRSEAGSVGPFDETAFPLNLAAAVAICISLGVETAHLSRRCSDLPKPDHRQSISRSELGYWIIDDTYNSNPAGARSGLDLLTRTGTGRKVLVTPGMVELGPIQKTENAELARLAAGWVDDLVVVGNTNRSALLAGSAGRNASVTVVANRVEAVEWVRANLKEGDAVLYENDLPDHYP